MGEKRVGNTDRLTQLTREAERLSEQIEAVVNHRAQHPVLMALALVMNEVAATPTAAVTADVAQNARVSRYALQFVRVALADAPEWATDPLTLLQFLANAMAHVTAEAEFTAVPGTRRAKVKLPERVA